LWFAFREPERINTMRVKTAIKAGPIYMNKVN